MTQRWKRLDITQSDVYYINSEDKIYYAREYISGRNYSASDANQLISNFKKPIQRKNNPAEWKYKIRAIDQFAQELSSLLDDKTSFVFAAIPSSRCKTDSDYDPRLEEKLKKLKKIKKNIIIEEPILIKETLVSSHTGGTRDPDLLYNNMIWNGFKVDTHHVFLIDDVLTTGSHFRACKKMILEHYTDMEVLGIFWARTIWPDVSPF